MKRNGVLVTDGNERATLAVVRSLGRRGVPVYVGAEAPASLAGRSRYCTASFVYPSPWRDPAGYVDSLKEAVARWNIAALFPMTDIAMEMVGERREELERLAALPIPSLDQYHRLSDKSRLTTWAEAAGIPVPPTIHIPDGQVEVAIAQLDRWPVVIKPGRSLLKVDGAWRKSQVLIAQDAAELRKLYHDHWFLKQPSMIQSYVTGHGEGVFGLFAGGEPLELFAHRRLRERPPSGGVSVFRESIPLPEPMTAYALEIMKDARWDGIAMVEFKVDAVSRVPYLMEVNGRFWGSLQLAIDAGLDFPWLLYGAGTRALEADERRQYRVGVRSQWWLGDLDHVLARFKERKAAPTPGASRQSLASAVISLVNVFDRSTRNEVMRATDPLPGLLEASQYVRSKLNGLGRKIGWRASRSAGKLSTRLADARLALPAHERALDQRLPAYIGNILVLCRGNICRSPFAAEWLKAEAQKRQLDLVITSAGLDAINGREAYPVAKAAAPEFDIDLLAHRAAFVSRQMVDAADIILVMEPGQARHVAELFPDARDKTFLLGHFASPRATTVIDDPYGRSIDEFRACFATLVSSCQGVLHRIETNRGRA